MNDTVQVRVGTGRIFPIRSGPVKIRPVCFWGQTGQNPVSSDLVWPGSTSGIQSKVFIHMNFYEYFLDIFTFSLRIFNSGYCFSTQKAKQNCFRWRKHWNTSSIKISTIVDMSPETSPSIVEESKSSTVCIIFIWFIVIEIQLIRTEKIFLLRLISSFFLWKTYSVSQARKQDEVVTQVIELQKHLTDMSQVSSHKTNNHTNGENNTIETPSVSIDSTIPTTPVISDIDLTNQSDTNQRKELITVCITCISSIIIVFD